MRRILVVAAMLWAGGVGAQTAAPFTLQQILSAPYASGLVASPVGGQFAWVENAEGVRNVWVGAANEAARQVTKDTDDDGQEIRGLVWSPRGKAVAYTYGAETGAGGRPANPAELQADGALEVRVQPVDGGVGFSVRGRSPLFSPSGDELFWIDGGKIWSRYLDGDPPPAAANHALVVDRGNASDMTISPDGKLLAYVSHRRDHSFIGLFDLRARMLRFVGASTGVDFAPSWSADGKELAWVRGPFEDVAEFAANRVSATPWSVMVADLATPDKARAVFTAEANQPGSALPHMATGEPRVWWMADGRVVFASEADGWLHLYAVDTKASGARAVLLTPGKGEVEDVTVGPHGELVWSSNVPVCDRGICDLKDEDRRHLWRLNESDVAVPVARGGEGIEGNPQVASDGTIAGMMTGWMAPMHPTYVAKDGRALSLRGYEWGKEFPKAATIKLKPQQVLIPLHPGMKNHLPADDVRVSLHGQLFLPGDSAGKKPAILFFHGGPHRQMLLGYPAMEYYSNAFAMNQYLASRGFVVLSVNYHCGIGYGMEFRQCEHAGATGASEYADVLAAVAYLRGRKDVDAKRIGIWGGSYGGYLTAMALARNSDLFAAGVDFHGVHDWNLEDNAGDWLRGNNAEKDAIAAKARASSPIADVAKWKSPVLLIHGDDDPEVAYRQTPMLAEALRARGVHVEEMVFPDEVHGFLLHRDWLKAYEGAAEFFERVLKPAEAVK